MWLDLGSQAFTGRFPTDGAPDEPSGPLEIVHCAECSFVQLSVRYDSTEFFGDEYGYRSGLNAGMVRHLRSKVDSLERRMNISPDDVVLDIGSNDEPPSSLDSDPGRVRCTARIACPLRTSRSMRVRPMKPDAPVTAMFMR